MNYFRRSCPFCLHTIENPQEKLAIQKTHSLPKKRFCRYRTRSNVRDKKMVEFHWFSRKHIGIKDTYSAYVRIKNSGMNFTDINELLRKL